MVGKDINRALIVALIVVVGLVTGEDIQKTRVLVLYDNTIFRYTHSLFFDDLEQNGYVLEYQNINSAAIELKVYGEFNYDQIIVLASGEIDSKGLSRAKLLDFFDSGRNIFFATDVDASKYVRLLFSEFGVEIDDLGSRVEDGFNYLSESYDQSLIQSTNLINEKNVVSRPEDPILYRGVGLTLTKYETYQIFSALKGMETTISVNVEQSQTLNRGNLVSLVACAQGRNNARIVLSGSIEMLSNDFYKYRSFGNRRFVNDLIAWNFGESGIIRVGTIYHHKTGEKEASYNYKIMDDLEYGIELFEWNRDRQIWIPYKTDKDILMEFVMLDPYVRLPLKQVGETAQYQINFRAPDKHGIFQFQVNYRRPGYNFIAEATKVTLRPYNHNEYERYLKQAVPYYLSTWGTVLGFFVFILFFLFDKEKEKVKKE